VEDTQHDRRFPGQDFKLVAFRSRPAFFVEPRGADRYGGVAIGVVADGKATPLLADLPAQRFLLEVLELELIKDPADLDAEGGLLIVAIQPICHRDHVNPGEMELGQDGQHEVVIARQPREVIDQHEVEGALLSGGEERGQSRAVFPGARLGLVGVDVLFENREAALGREAATRGHLVLDAFGALILRAVSSIDGGAHRYLSCRDGVGAISSSAACSIRRMYSRASSSAR